MTNAEKADKSGGETAQDKRARNQPLGDHVQAHYGRASKFADGNARNWTIFFFFRILSQSDAEANASVLKRLTSALRETDRKGDDLRKAAAEVLWTLKDPAL